MYKAGTAFSQEGRHLKTQRCTTDYEVKVRNTEVHEH